MSQHIYFLYCELLNHQILIVFIYCVANNVSEEMQMQRLLIQNKYAQQNN